MTRPIRSWRAAARWSIALAAITSVSAPACRKQRAAPAPAAQPPAAAQRTPETATTPVPETPLVATSPDSVQVLQRRVAKRFGRVAGTTVPPVLDNPTPQTMTAIVTAATQANGGDPRAAEKTLRDAIAAEPEASVREMLSLRVADTLMLQATPESRRAARELLENLGKTTALFYIQTNALRTLDRLDAEHARGP